jgi:hypothetical protein
MTRVVFTACLLVACSLAAAKDPEPLVMQKGARIGVVNLLDAEVTQYHTARVLAQSFLKTQLVGWSVETMLSDAVTPRLRQLGLVPVPLGPGDALIHDRHEAFVNNSVAKGLPREIAREFATLAATARVDALLVLVASLNNSSQAAGPPRRGLPEYLRGWGFVTTDSPGKTSLFNMTQVLLIAITSEGATLRARQWGGNYTEELADYAPPADPKQLPPDLLDKLQPMFARMLAGQAARVMDRINSG